MGGFGKVGLTLRGQEEPDLRDGNRLHYSTRLQHRIWEREGPAASETNQPTNPLPLAGAGAAKESCVSGPLRRRDWAIGGPDKPLTLSLLSI